MSSLFIPLALSRWRLATKTRSLTLYLMLHRCLLLYPFFITIFVLLRAHLAMLQLICTCFTKWLAAGIVSLVSILEGCPTGWHPLLSQKGVCPVTLCSKLLYVNLAAEIQSAQSLCFSAKIQRYFSISLLTHSVCPSIWGWYGMLMFVLIWRSPISSFIKHPANCRPQSL